MVDFDGRFAVSMCEFGGVNTIFTKSAGNPIVEKTSNVDFYGQHR